MAKASKPKPDSPKKSIFNLDNAIQKQLKYVAFTDERTMTEIVNEALADYLAKWEKKHGPIPDKYKEA
jgi:predicted transcriptional regulator